MSVQSDFQCVCICSCQTTAVDTRAVTTSVNTTAPTWWREAYFVLAGQAISPKRQKDTLVKVKDTVTLNPFKHGHRCIFFLHWTVLFFLISSASGKTDVNECEVYGTCPQECKNTKGSYECFCANGFLSFGEPHGTECAAQGKSSAFTLRRKFFTKVPFYQWVKPNHALKLLIAFIGGGKSTHILHSSRSTDTCERKDSSSDSAALLG